AAVRRSTGDARSESVRRAGGNRRARRRDGGGPMGGFKLGMGAKIGIGIGVLGAVVGLGAAVMAMGWVHGVGGPSAVCKHAAACCRKMGGSASSCDNLTKQSGPVADTVCEESLKGFRKSGHCK